MKIYKKNFKDLFFELGIDNLDDLWVLSLFISKGDKLGSKTTRRFRVQDSEDSEKKKVFIVLNVDNIKLDLDMQILKIIGTIESGSPQKYVNVGEHHSFDLRIGDKISITKTNLLDLQKKILNKAEQAKQNPDVCLVVLDDDSCVIASLNESRYNIIAEIPFKGSGKRVPKTKETSRKRYFDSILKVITTKKINKVIVGGPGFEKVNLQKYIYNSYPNLKKIFTFTQVSSPGVSGIRELINGGAVKTILSDLNVQKDFKLINEFLLNISKDKPVTYGLEQIKDALERNALKLVLISDKFFHDNFSEIKTLLLELENKKIEYHIMSSENEPGKMLDNMSGIAAFLYF